MIIAMHKILPLRFIIRCNSSLTNATISIPSDIKIPKTIYRNELSILKALATCVQCERGSPAYSVIDQPETVPLDPYWHKKYVWSKVSGKLSARIAFKEIRNEFINVACDEPRVKRLMPLIDAKDIEKEVEKNGLSPEIALGKLVRLLSPTDAWRFYETHKENKFSKDVIQNLLELLCATAGVDPNPEFDTEDGYTKYERTIWRIDNIAELLFSHIEEKTMQTYCAIIRGAAKFRDPSRALELFRMMQTQLPDEFLDLATVNSLLYSLSLSKMEVYEICDLVLELLESMARHKIAPNILTFNNAIYAFNEKDSKGFTESLYGELMACGLEPTLGTYAVIIRSRYSMSLIYGLVTDVVHILETRAIDYEETLSLHDYNLFKNMMYFIRNMKDVDLALRLNAIVDRGSHIHMFINNGERAHYFDLLFMTLLASTYEISDLLDLMARYIPRFLLPEKKMAPDILARIKQSNEVRLLPAVLHLFNWSNSNVINAGIFQTVLDMFATADYEADPGLRELVSESLARILEDDRCSGKSVLADVDVLRATMNIAIKIGDVTLFWRLVEYARRINIARASLIGETMDACYEHGDLDRIPYLWKCIADCVHSLAMTRQSERDSLGALIARAEKEMLPALDKCNVASREMQVNIDQCKFWLQRNLSEEEFLAEESRTSMKYKFARANKDKDK